MTPQEDRGGLGKNKTKQNTLGIPDLDDIKSMHKCPTAYFISLAFFMEILS